jgi:hypothetical protein
MGVGWALESDSDLRARLLYVTGDERVGRMSAAQLDDLAERYNLRRRRLSL